MQWLIFKYALTAALVVLISEVAKRSDKLGGLIAALPLVTVLALIWMYAEGQSMQKISNHAFYTFWYVLPTLPMFLIFPYLLNRVGFIAALGVSALLTLLVFVLFALLMRRFGVHLW